jgi:hypothetical protein
MKSQSKMNVAIGFILLGMSVVPAFAADNAVIKNKAFSERTKEVDTAVVVKKINDLDIEADQSETEVSPGERTLEVECVVRTFVGMGTVDIGKLKRFTLPLEAGKTYQLGGKITEDGECTPTID